MTFRMLLKPKNPKPNMPMDMTWVRLILLGLNYKQPKKIVDTGSSKSGWLLYW